MSSKPSAFDPAGVGGVTAPSGLPAFLGVDVGTSSLKTLVVDDHGEVLHRTSADYPTAHPAPGRFEQDPWDWVAALTLCLSRCPESVRARVRSIGVCGQVPTLVLVDGAGDPVRPALTWQDARAADAPGVLEDLFGPAVAATGTELAWQPSQVPAKLLWLGEHEPTTTAQARWALAPKDFVTFQLTGRVTTDPWTSKGLVNVLAAEPVPHLARTLGFRPDLCPPVRQPWEDLGPLTAAAAARLGLLPSVRVAVGWTDAMAAVLAVGAFERPTGFVLTGTSDVVGLSSTSSRGCAGLYDVPAEVAPLPLLYGPTQSSGASLLWVCRTLNLSVETALEMAAESSSDTPVFVPYLNGERAPLWNPAVRATFLGLSEEHGAAELVRSVLDGIACSSEHVLSLAAAATGQVVDEVQAAGPGVAHPLLAQLRADATARTLVRHDEPNPSGLGAVMLAAMATGSTLHDLARLRGPVKTFAPRHEDEEVPLAFPRYLAAAQVASAWPRP